MNLNELTKKQKEELLSIIENIKIPEHEYLLTNSEYTEFLQKNKPEFLTIDEFETFLILTVSKQAKQEYDSINNK